MTDFDGPDCDHLQEPSGLQLIDLDGLDLTPQERSVLRRADENPEHLTAHDQSVLGALVEEGGERRRVAVRLLDVATGSGVDWQVTALAEPLAAALEEGPYTVRKRVPGALGTIGVSDPDAVSGAAFNALVDALADEQRMVRTKAVRALGELGAAAPGMLTHQMGFLAAALDDEDDLVREAAADALGQVGAASPERAADVVDPLVAALDDEVASVRWTAAEALGRVRANAPGDADIAGPLTAALADDSAVVREKSAAALGRLGAETSGDVEAAVGPLTAALDDDEDEVRSTAATALGRLGGVDPELVDGAIGALVAALDDDNPITRENAATALGRIGETDPERVVDAIEPLLDVAHDKYPDARIAGATALGHVAPAGTVDEIVEVFVELGYARMKSGAHPNIRRAAAVALGRLLAGVGERDRADEVGIGTRLEATGHDPEELLTSGLEDRLDVAVGAAFAVFRAGVVDHDLRATARDRLREGLGTADHRRLTAELVAELAATGPAVHPMMRGMFNDDVADDPAVRDLIPDLVALLETPGADTRRAACRALGHLDATAARPELERLAENDEQAAVREAATAAVDRLDVDDGPAEADEAVTADDDAGDSDEEVSVWEAAAEAVDRADTTDGPAADDGSATGGDADGGETEVATADGTRPPADPESEGHEEPAESPGSLADRAALYARLLEYARAESLHECRRWARELRTFVEANPVDDEGYEAAREQATRLADERLPATADAFGSDHDLVTGDEPLAEAAPDLHEAIEDATFAVRRCYVRGE